MKDVNKSKDKNHLIRLSKSVIGEEEKISICKVLDKGYLGMGSFVKKFENELSNMLGRETICLTNGTAALQLALQGCDIGKGDEVLVQSITYLASFQSISATGAKPIACDIDLDSLTIDIEDAEKRITKRTKAIMPVHYAGDVGKYEEIYKFAKKYDLRVIEDAAHAFGTTYNNKFVGSFGDVVCFSFDGIKNITSGEGGCISSNDKNLMNSIKDLRLLGVEKDTEARFAEKRSWEFDVFNQGWRYHMSDIMAAIGISQLKKLAYFSEKRQDLAKYYDFKFKDSKLIRSLKKDYSNVVPHIYPIILDTQINRNDFSQYLNDNNIQTGIHYQPNHLLTFFKDTKNDLIPLKNTNSIYKRILTLPLHPDLEKEDIDYISKLISTYQYL